MRIALIPALLGLSLCGAAQSVDRVYTADQTSNTVSVIDPVANRLLGEIRLGENVPTAISPLYRGQLLVHGLGFSPDHKTIDVISIGSNAVTLIDTQSNTVKGTVYVGRSPHEGFFTSDGKELWVAVRGENYVSVIDPIAMKEVRRIETANGPGMVLFRPDGKLAFVPSSFTPELDVIDTSTYRVIARIPQVSPFSPNLAVDQDEVWFTLKDTGKTQIISAQPPFKTIATLETGPITNHVTLIENSKGKFAYVTVGGKNEVLVYQRGSGAEPKLVSTIQVGDLPHGIWGSGDGKRVYIGLENGDAVQAIDTATNRVIATIPVGQLPQALVYVPGAASSDAGTASLKPFSTATDALHIEMVSASSASPSTHASVVVNPIGPIDNLQIAATGLTPKQGYRLMLTGASSSQELVVFTAGPGGVGIAQTFGPLKHAVDPAQSSDSFALEVWTLDADGKHHVVLHEAPRH
ncbi:40-residue YVTN beta-propeller repeat protein [Candidatus Koribacter versatilis Ellin345]|uniref:40-residue YVTN beta-propeller repeat protein n=1 Tax=Koribacter versatilis (strain Ellin345) TaxID=204669 RepID=Q1IQ65_KORVE|nr:YncE family protein [Candidatus Koribacter versatilis]ABF40985.1 40-residue YVTN beta-propeller repeat protein [Candidatus Koribacter versatilis Ellin345]